MRDYYTEMRNGGFAHEKGYAATLGRWIQYTGHGFDYEDDGGWKFKICIAHEDVPKAWNIVTNIILGNSYPQSATVVGPELLAQRKAQNSEHKVISIDTLSTVSPARYMVMMAHIEQELRAAGITPAPVPPGERAVSNSQYIAYGYDLQPNGTYNPEHEPKRNYNPLKHHDPYAAFKVEPLPSALNVKPDFLSLSTQDFPGKEFLRHEWMDANWGSGQIASRLPILGMEMSKVQKIMSELSQQGLSPRVRESKQLGGLVIAVEGEDAIKFRSINPRVPEFLKLQWQAAHVESGGDVVRIPVGDMSNEQLVRLVVDLRNSGFNPVPHDSKTLGKTVRLKGDDVRRLESLRSQLRQQP
ncbi:MAG: hypothetical protein HYS17_09040 [Micavibrio aeruginosavorus]|uniref:Uncharacterized protein n=1 Tax=Micavibrio aeruginosavorus TaxID=349221 RepID=A0A7T5R175_9BACT|nr:MAG: hypothetical protein HYS17_09040 [Micavibrio aeruginosavorus]